MNAGQGIAIGLSVLLALWFAGGIWYNRRRRSRVWGWLQAGLDAFGGQVSMEWLGSSGGGLRVAVANPLAPFRRVELIVRLQARENLPLWLFELAQGKRDQLTLRAWLRSPGRGEIEVASVNSKLDRALQTSTSSSWQRIDVIPHWTVAHRGKVREEQIAALREFIAAHNGQLERLSLRRSEPHVFIQMSLDGLTNKSSRQLLDQVSATMVA